MSIFGSRLKYLRESKELTQKELATLIGTSNVMICKYETNDNAFPSYEHLIKISKVFNVSLDYLLGLTDDKNIQTSEESSDLSIAISIGKLYSLDDNSHLSKTQIELIKKLLLANKDFILSA